MHLQPFLVQNFVTLFQNEISFWRIEAGRHLFRSLTRALVERAMNAAQWSVQVKVLFQKKYVQIKAIFNVSYQLTLTTCVLVTGVTLG